MAIRKSPWKLQAYCTVERRNTFNQSPVPKVPNYDAVIAVVNQDLKSEVSKNILRFDLLISALVNWEQPNVLKTKIV